MSNLACQFGPHQLTELGPESYSGPGVHITVRSPMAPPTWGLQTEHFYVEWTAAGDVDVDCKGLMLQYDDLFGKEAEDWDHNDVAAKARERLIALRDELDWLIDGVGDKGRSG